LREDLEQAAQHMSAAFTPLHRTTFSAIEHVDCLNYFDSEAA
jgi:hypothetical protein